MAIKRRKRSANKIYYAIPSDICHVQLFSPVGDMRKSLKCHCIMVELKSAKQRNSQGKMGKPLFTERRRWNRILYDS